jgi:Fic family protein
MLAVAEDSTLLMRYRIRGEFLEMPGLHLTLEQAARLWHMDAATCAVALRRLVAERFLVRTRSGAYKRAEQV